LSLLQFLRVKTCEVLIDNKLENMPGLKELNRISVHKTNSYHFENISF